jgi:predicted DNA-binding transcriptional regulator YafY
VELSRSAVRLSRLLKLIAVLSETTVPMTSRELREQVGGYGENDVAFRRNFVRDKDELRDLGIEIEIVERSDLDPPVPAYRIPRSSFALRDPGLTPEEAGALQLAVSLVRFDGLAGGDGLWKVGGGAAAAPTGGAALTSDLPATPQLATLFGAVAERRTTTFGYRGRERVVEPYRLHFARGRWYLLARERGDEEAKHFRLDRIDGVPAVGAAWGFEAPRAEVVAGVPDPWQLGDGPPRVARVAIDGPQAPSARATLGPEAVVEEHDDGSIVVELAVTHDDGFRSFLLGFLDHAEVLGPPELRADVVAWLEELAR